jgi:hypothetical protein
MRTWLGGIVLFAAAVGPGRGRAQGGAAEAAVEIAGLVRARDGSAAGGADVVVTDPEGASRRAAICDPEGRFSLSVPGGGPIVVRIYTSGGAVVAGHVADATGLGRLWLEVEGSRVVRVDRQAPPGALAAVAPAAPGGRPIVRTRDLGGLVEATPGGAPATPMTFGPGLLGAGQGELRVTLAGMKLTDPLGGRAPLRAPLALFAPTAARADLGAALDDATGGGLLALAAPAADRRAAVTFESAGAWTAAPRGPGGASAEGRVETQAQVASAGGGARLWVAAAPVRGAEGPALDRPYATVHQERALTPAVARADLRAGAWTLDATGLALHEQRRDRPAARIVPLDARDRETETWGAGTATARRHFEAGAELRLRASALRTTRTLTTVGDLQRREGGQRFEGAAETRLEGRFGGRHVLEAGAGVDLARGDRASARDERPALAALGRARGRNLTTWAAVHERWEPIAPVSVEAGLRAQHASLASANDLRTGEHTLSSDVLLAPRFALTLRHAATGASIGARVGRYAAPLPVAPLLALGDAARPTPTLPHEDVAAFEGRLRLGPVALAALALDRRTRAVLEDGFVPGTSSLSLTNRPAARRRHQALVVAAELARARTRLRAAYVLSRQRGSFPGFADPGAGRLRPWSTGAHDLAPVDGPTGLDVNRTGPLPFDRRHGLRVAAEQGATWGPYRLSVGAAGRLDSGAPWSARARDPVAGTPELLLVTRGTAGRLPWTGAVDAAVALGRTLGRGRVWLLAEAFNLTNHRRPTARDEVWSDRPVVPLPGARGQASLGALRGPEGEDVVPSMGYGRATAWTEPVLVRLALRLEL